MIAKFIERRMGCALYVQDLKQNPGDGSALTTITKLVDSGVLSVCAAIQRLVGSKPLKIKF